MRWPEWDWGFAAAILPDLLQATQTTLLVTVAGFAGAIVLGLPLALARDGRWRTMRLASGAMVELVRSTPLLIQVYILYFVLPSAGVVLPALAIGVGAISLHYGAYACEAYRAGLAAVARGQRDAAAALALPRRVAFLRVVLPQALPPILPVLGNYLIAIFKDTPVLSAIALSELLQRAKLIGSESFRYNEAFTEAGLIFLALSLGASALVRASERRWRGDRSG